MLKTVAVAEENVFYSSLDDILYDKARTKLLLCPRDKAGSVLIPASVTNLGYRAFCGCSGLKQFTVEEGNRWYASVDGVLYTKDMKKLARLSTFAPTANFFRRETPRDAAVGRESPQIAVAKAV